MTWLGALLAATWVLANLNVPLVEDSLFWWMPKALLVSEGGPQVILAGELPQAMLQEPLPPQWADGLPDYLHPPLWYWWVGLFLWISPTVQAIHAACLVPAAAIGAGVVALGTRLGNAWAGLAVLSLPPLLAQLLRPELDLPMLAIVLWALVALLDRRWTSFAVLGILAPWCKEPGVLLVAPAVWIMFRERQFRWQALSPLFGLALWALVRGELAKPESLPHSPAEAAENLIVAARIVFVEQGRWLLLAGLPFLFRRHAIAVFALTWLVFFSVVGFFANQGGLEPLTHVRYLLPGMVVGAIALGVRWPWLAVIGLLWLRIRSPFGPEASLFGLDAALAERDAATWIMEQEEPWVGSFQGAGLTQPWAGIVTEPASHIRLYHYETDPLDIPEGAVLLQAAYGEPIGTIERTWKLSELERWTRGHATVVAWRVAGP